MVARADLAISKDLTTPQMIAGDPATYAIAVTNLGPSVSAGPFSVTDTLPSTTTFISAAGPGWACDPIAAGAVGATLTCTQAASLDVGASTMQLVVTVGIPSSQTAAVVNTATISATTTADPNPDNDTATVTTTPATSADLFIQKQHVGSFVAGDDEQYTLEVRNFGPSDAADATIADTLPDGLTYLDSGDADWACSASGQQVTCSHASPLPADTDTTVTLNVHLDPDLDPSVPIENTAVVSSATPDPDLTNNSSTDTSNINESADLAITKSHSGNAVAGEPFTYTLSVVNSGPSEVAGPVTVTDPLPAGLSYVSATGAGWTCANPSGTPSDPQLVTCTLAGGLDAGATAPDITLDVMVAPDAGPSTIVNSATVESDVADPNLDNNSASDPTEVDVSTATDSDQNPRHPHAGGGRHRGHVHLAGQQLRAERRRRRHGHRHPARRSRLCLRYGRRVGVLPGRRRRGVHPGLRCGRASRDSGTDHRGNEGRSGHPDQPTRRHDHP